MLTRKRQAKTRIRIQVTVGNVVYDLPNRPATRPIRLFELIASQTLNGIAQIARQSLQFRNPSLAFGTPNRRGRTIRPDRIAEIHARAINGIWFFRKLN